MNPFFPSDEAEFDKSPNFFSEQMFDFKSLKDLVPFLEANPEIQERLAESAAWQQRPITSVWEMTETFPPGFYEETVNKIHHLLVSLGFQDTPTLIRMAEHLFSDIYVGRPDVDPALLCD